MRPNFFASSFYSEKKEVLKQIINGYARQMKKENQAIAGICPHAGHIYSGKLAFKTMLNLKDIDRQDTTVIFVGPSHTGYGDILNLSKENWNTPFGEVVCDIDFCNLLLENSNIIKENEEGHFREHSIEVLLPFLKYLNKDAKFVAISMTNQNLEMAVNLSKKIIEAKSKKNRNYLLIASSDFTHFLTKNRSEIINKKAIELIEKLDLVNFYEFVKQNNVSICGYGPICVLMDYAKKMGIDRARLLEYYDSSKVTFDKNSVVGYASIIF